MESDDKEKDLIDKVSKFSNFSKNTKSYSRKTEAFLFGCLTCFIFCFGSHIVNFSFLKGFIVSFVLFLFVKSVSYLSALVFWNDSLKVLEEYSKISK